MKHVEALCAINKVCDVSVVRVVPFLGGTLAICSGLSFY